MAGGGTNLTWGFPRSVPVATGKKVGGADLAVYGGALYVVWGEGDDNGMGGIVNPVLKLAKKTGDANWQFVGIVITNVTSGRIAVSSSGIHVIVPETYGTSSKYLRSTDGGATWSAPILLSGNNSSPGYGALRADDNYVYLAYNDYGVPESHHIRFRRMAKNANQWEAERIVMDYSSYKTSGYVNDFEVRGRRKAQALPERFRPT